MKLFTLILVLTQIVSFAFGVSLNENGTSYTLKNEWVYK